MNQVLRICTQGFIVFILAFPAGRCGAQWLPIVQLTDTPGLSATSYPGGVNGRQIAVDQSDVHIVWYDQRGAGSEIYYMRSTDEGDTWEDEVIMTNDAGTAIVPVVAALASVVHVLWTDDRDGVQRLYYRRSVDHGEFWESEILLSSDSCKTTDPAIVCSGQDVYVIWQNRTDIGLSIGLRRSTDGGATWLQETSLWRMEELSSSAYFLHPSIAVTESVLMYVWTNFQGEGRDLFASRSTDNGQTWQEPIRITDSPSSDFLPFLAMEGDAAHVLWWSKGGTSRVQAYYSRSLDAGRTWTPARVFSDVGTNTSWRGRIACAGNNVHVVWGDTRIGVDVFYSNSSDRGETWGDEIPVSDSRYGNAQDASVAVQGERVHVVWMQGSGSDAQIYYRKNPTGNLTDVRYLADAAVPLIQLDQNYPNPCRDRTSVSYELAQRSDVRIHVYDGLGRRVATVERLSQDAGTHTVSLMTAGLPRGNYYYVLEAGGERIGRHMMVW